MNRTKSMENELNLSDSVQKRLDSHLSRITELQSMIEEEEKGVFDCLQQQKAKMH